MLEEEWFPADINYPYAIYSAWNRNGFLLTN